MERDQFHVETETVEEPATAEPAEYPALRIHFDGSHDRLRQGLSEQLRDDIAVEEIDDAVVPLRVRHTIGGVPEQERPIVELDFIPSMQTALPLMRLSVLVGFLLARPLEGRDSHSTANIEILSSYQDRISTFTRTRR